MNAERWRASPGLVKVPVTATLSGLRQTRRGKIADFARATIATGAVGLNFERRHRRHETSFVELNLQVEKIAALREAGKLGRRSVVINARTRIYLCRSAGKSRASTGP